jgi:hypothetical protein
MYLVRGGDMKGIERIAASWAEQHGVQQVRFGPIPSSEIAPASAATSRCCR